MKLLILLFTLALCTTSLAQTFNATTTETFKNDHHANLAPLTNGFIGMHLSDNKWQMRNFKLTKERYGLSLIRYDEKMKITRKFELPGGSSLYGPYIPRFKSVNGHLYLFYYQFHEKDNVFFKTFMAEIDTVNLTLGTPVELFSIEESSIGDFNKEDERMRAGFYIISSPDNSKIGLIWNSGLSPDVYYKVLNKDLSPVHQKKHTIKKPGNPQFKSVALDNDGNIWLAAKANQETYITCFASNGTQTEKKLKLNHDKALDAHLAATPGGMITVAGTYSDDINYILGAYNLSLDPKSFSFGDVTQLPIPPEVKLLLAKDTWAPASKTKDGIRQVDLVPYILDDGSITLVGEYRRTDIVTTGSGAKFYHLSGSLLYIRTGKNMLITRIPKLRVSTGNRIGDSYKGIPYKDQLIIFYDDSKANLKRDLKDGPATSDKYNEVMLVAVTIDNNGYITRQPVIDLMKEDFFPIADRITIASPTKLIVPIPKIGMLGGVHDEFKWGYVTITD